MIDNFFVRAQVRARLKSGLLGPYLDVLVVSLQEQQYSTRSIRQHLHAADAFGRWLAQQGLPVADVFRIPGVFIGPIVNGLWGLGTALFLSWMPGSAARVR